MAKVVKGRTSVEFKTEHKNAAWFTLASTSSTAATAVWNSGVTHTIAGTTTLSGTTTISGALSCTSTVSITGITTLKASAHAGLVAGSGTSATPCDLSTTADKHALSFYFTTAAATGTSRGMYLRQYLTGGAGGEALRVFNTVSNNTPADTVNGAHISLNFGASAGNVTGLGTAVRATLHVPNRALTGTTAAIQAEVYADGSSSSVSGTCSLIRGIVDGEATGKAACDSSVFLLDLTATAGAYNSGEMIVASNSGTITGALKVRINGATKYIPYIDSAVAP